MTRKLLLERIKKAINQLPEDKAEEIADFAEFILKKHEDEFLSKVIQQLVSGNKSFEFLKEEENIYSESDIKEFFWN